MSGFTFEQENWPEIRVIDPESESRIGELAKKVFKLVRHNENIVEISPRLADWLRDRHDVRKPTDEQAKEFQGLPVDGLDYALVGIPRTYFDIVSIWTERPTPKMSLT